VVGKRRCGNAFVEACSTTPARRRTRTGPRLHGEATLAGRGADKLIRIKGGLGHETPN
jgi:hypothetical protein